MKTRRQSTRRGGQTKKPKKSSGQTKKPKKRKIDRLQLPILSSSASSSTVARSSGLSMVVKHVWTEPEELALFREAEILHVQVFPTKSLLYKALSDRLNELFPEVAVQFNAKIIKNKIDSYKDRLSTGHPLKTRDKTPIGCSATLHDILFSETTSGSTYSGAADTGADDSVNVNNGTKKKKRYSIEACLPLVLSIQELSSDEKAAAADILRLEEDRKIFMNLTTHVRLSWIKQQIAKIKPPPPSCALPSSSRHGGEDGGEDHEVRNGAKKAWLHTWSSA